jgi:hypothetical protein
MRILKGLLLKDSIVSKSIKQFIEKRELEIIEANNKIESIKSETQKQIDKFQNDIKNLSLQIEQLKEREQKQILSIRENYKVNQEKIQSVPVHRIEPSEMQEYRTRNIFSKSADKIEISLNAPSYRKYAVIPFPKEARHLFPGFKIKFELETDIGVILTKVTSAPGGTKYGDPVAGAYIQGGLKRWYDSHPELKNGSVLLISVIEPKKRYSLSIK